jgi:putative acyl-CoA dehydrogenase
MNKLVNHTRAQGPGAGYFLNGHKWFTSAPMCDAFLTLAQTPKGLSCFLVPRWIPHTDERNHGLKFLRLKVFFKIKK